MRKFILALALIASPAAAATSSADLEALATQAEQSPSSPTLNAAILDALREPAMTLDNRTLPATPAAYTGRLSDALAVNPPYWLPGFRLNRGGVCTAIDDFWDTTDPPGLRFETFSWGKGTCAAVLTAAELRAWAWRLKQIGR